MNEGNFLPENIDLINGHATATLIGDPIEADAIKCFLGTHKDNLKQSIFQTENLNLDVIRKPTITAFKGNIGHLNLASGATEIALCIKAM